jgi:hypothetical protein
VVFATEAIDIGLVHSMKLESLGLVEFQGNQVIPSCRLYQQYFQQKPFQDNVPTNSQANLAAPTIPA